MVLNCGLKRHSLPLLRFILTSSFHSSNDSISRIIASTVQNYGIFVLLFVFVVQKSVYCLRPDKACDGFQHVLFPHLKFADMFHSLGFGAYPFSYIVKLQIQTHYLPGVEGNVVFVFFFITYDLQQGARGKKNLLISRILVSFGLTSFFQVLQYFRFLPFPPPSTNVWILGECERGLWGCGHIGLITMEVGQRTQTHSVLARFCCKRTWTGDC